jgi:acetoin:2,6-dichlorophenolindophenol oxidoreductase subunit alpha
MEIAALQSWLRQMWQIRVFEDHVARLSRAGEVPGFVHLCSGQEAVAVGICAVMKEGDTFFSGHRAHGHFLACGSDPYRLLAEILGRKDGVCGGYGGSMHLVDVQRGALGATGVVGGNIPLAAGAAWAVAEQGQNNIAVVFFGDGAGGSGAFHETLNLASLWRLPLLFVCENNGYAEFTSREEHSNVQHLSKFAAPYGIVSSVVDGNDILAVERAARQFIAEMRAGCGPRFIECMTYRLSGHYVGDPEQYRKKEEMAAWLERDPIQRLRGQLQQQGVDAASLDTIETEVRRELDAVVERARAAAMPDPAGTMAYVYADNVSIGEGG